MDVTQPTLIKLQTIDIVIVVLYLASIMGIGFAMKRKASKGMAEYFLGGRQLQWWALAMSGSSSYFDITGTMWIVSMFIGMGLKGMWIHWLWAFPITAFYMAYMGKWIRRSNVLTGAEWMYTRFGRTGAGDIARLSYTLFAVLTISGLLGYGAIGMGKFGAVFLPYSSFKCAVLILGITGLYVIAGGFHGIVRVEIIQTIVLSAGAITLAVVGYLHFDSATFASRVPADWGNIMPSWKPEMFKGKEFELFGAFVSVWLAKGILTCLSGPEQIYDFQRFLAARDTRDASKLGALWGVIHTVRWPFAMAIAVMAIGDPTLNGVLEKDRERALPLIIGKTLPVGLVGFMLAALLSGFLATFSSTVNGGAAYLVKDLYQRYWNPNAEPRTLIRASYVASVLLIGVGIAISYKEGSIATALGYIFGTLGAGILPPNVLRWYWWRTNGQGYAAGVFLGMILFLIHMVGETSEMIKPAIPLYYAFPVIAGLSTVATIVVSLLTEPTEMAILEQFYRNVQPWGLWGPVRRSVLALDPQFRTESSFGREALNTLLALIGITFLFVGPLYLILHRHTEAFACFGVTAAMAVILYGTWYKHLPPPAEAERS